MAQVLRRSFARTLLRATAAGATPPPGPTHARLGWEITLEPRERYRWFIDRLVEKIEQLGSASASSTTSPPPPRPRR